MTKFLRGLLTLCALFAALHAGLGADAYAKDKGDKDDEEEEWEEEDKPQLKFLELHGYFRLRNDLFHNLDLDTYNPSARDGRKSSSSVRPPVMSRVANAGDVNGRDVSVQSNTLAGSNMRFRMEPKLNISEEIQLLATIDMLDNLVLGSTPDAYQHGVDSNAPGGANTLAPLPPFSQSQSTMVEGRNSTRDSIAVKRAWAQVLTPVGQLRFGRMASQWGLGLIANAGAEIDSDRGSTVDRIMFITRVLDHYIVPAFDFVSEGPTSSNLALDGPEGQPYDIEQKDDVNQWVLAIARRDTPEVAKEKLESGKAVINYGMYNVWRTQTLDFPQEYAPSNAVPPNGSNEKLASDNALLRDVFLWIPDLWFKFQYKKFYLETEWVAILGRIGCDGTGKGPAGGKTDTANLRDPTIKEIQEGWVTEAELNKLLGKEGGSTQKLVRYKPQTDANGKIRYDENTGRALPDYDSKTGAVKLVEEPRDLHICSEVAIKQFGGVVKANYALFNDKLKIGVEYGFASGDRAAGFGTRPLQDSDIQYNQNTERLSAKDSDRKKDLAINNFRFHPEYRVDLILWREVIGTITDAMYFKQSTEFQFVEGFGIGLDIIYSRAVFAESTPGFDKDLGLELDSHLFYKSSDGFIAWLDWGVLFPFAGLDNLGDDYDPNSIYFDPEAFSKRRGSDPPRVRAKTLLDGEKDPPSGDIPNPFGDYEAQIAHRLRANFAVTF